jgi:hypothetical protein
MSPRTACGIVANDDTDDWKWVTCTACLGKQHGLALNRAHYYGKEFEANPGSSMREYLDDCACHWGADTFAELPGDKKSAIRKAFDEGRVIERAARRS